MDEVDRDLFANNWLQDFHALQGACAPLFGLRCRGLPGKQGAILGTKRFRSI